MKNSQKNIENGDVDTKLGTYVLQITNQGQKEDQ